MNWINRLFCTHDYTEVKSFEVKSEFDILKEAGYAQNTWSSMTRQYVTDYRCKNCGKLKRLVIKTQHQ